jgi:hypothetical protein
MNYELRRVITFDNAKVIKPNTKPEKIPTTGPVKSIIKRGESGRGILEIMIAS